MKNMIKSVGLIFLIIFLMAGCTNSYVHKPYKRALTELISTNRYSGKHGYLGLQEVLIIEERGNMAKVKWSGYWGTFWVNTDKDFIRLD